MIQDDDANIFDNLPALAKPKHSLCNNELETYLNTPTEDTDNVLKWWQRQEATYPHLSRMALDYLTIPGAYFFLIHLLQFVYIL